MSIEDKVKVNKIGKQISESEHKATQNTLNKPTKHLPEASKAVYETYKSSIRTETSAYKPTLQQEEARQSTPPQKPGIASSIETPEIPAPRTKPISTEPLQVVTKNLLNVASKNPVNAIAQKLINKFTTGNKPIHKTKQSPTPSASPTNKQTGKSQSNSR